MIANPKFVLLLSILTSGLLLVSSRGAELKHFWDFEGEEWGSDKVGLADGTVTPATTLGLSGGAGGVGNSLEVMTTVGGDDDHLVVDSAELFDPGEEAFSISFWIKMPDDATTEARGIFDFSGNGLDGVQSLFIGSTNELAFRIDFNFGGVALVKVPMTLEDDLWHLIVGIYDPAVGLQVHIDGFGVDGSALAVAEPVSMAADCYIGSFNFTGAVANKGIGGSIDDFAIYSGALDEAEITALMVRELPDIEPIESVSYSGGTISITWQAPAGAKVSVWRSYDLDFWWELEDVVEAGVDGGSFDYLIPEPVPSRVFLQLRRGAK